MGTKAKKFARGAPRYSFTDSDSKTIRFTSSKTRKIVLSQLVDISETGVAFTTSYKLCPRVGEIIKMDFVVPGTFQIAVEGRIVRTEEPTKYSSWARFPGTVKVGVIFFNVPRAYKKVMANTLHKLLNARHQDQREELVITKTSEPSWVLENAGSIVAAVLFILIFAGGLYYFLNVYQPSTTPEAPNWAQSFFDKNIPKSYK